MTVITLDGGSWTTSRDLYRHLLPALCAPNWHGENLDALNDTIRGDDINEVRLPFTVRITGAASMGPDARQTVDRFASLVADLKASGVDVTLMLA